MNIKEKATELHDSGFNCAQSVLCACGAYTHLDEASALAVSGGFGGGVRCGEICGALSGAVMAIGLANPFVEADNAEAKDKIADLTRRCTAAFENEFGALRCTDLKEAGHSCSEVIEYAAELAEKIICEEQ